MKSKQSPHFSGTFDSVVWRGNAPLNKAREALLAQLRLFLGYEGELASDLSPAAQRQLVLGNAEDHDASWPKADGKYLYVGLFTKRYPDSEILLKNYEENLVSFYLHENIQLSEVDEFLSDLLKS